MQFLLDSSQFNAVSMYANSLSVSDMIFLPFYVEESFDLFYFISFNYLLFVLMVDMVRMEKAQAFQSGIGA